MPKATLRHLKRFVELEDGFSRLLSVILLGQNELAEKLDPRDPSVREVVQRCEIITLPPLGEHLEDYLRFRLRRFSVDLSKIVTADGLQAARAFVAAGAAWAHRTLVPLPLGGAQPLDRCHEPGRGKRRSGG